MSNLLRVRAAPATKLVRTDLVVRMHHLHEINVEYAADDREVCFIRTLQPNARESDSAIDFDEGPTVPSGII